jgi:hypothetical protein
MAAFWNMAPWSLRSRPEACTASAIRAMSNHCDDGEMLVRFYETHGLMFEKVVIFRILKYLEKLKTTWWPCKIILFYN